jgi:hypothetical protein
LRWFIVEKTEKRGPFTSQEIRSKLRSNEATLDTLIVKEGSPLCRKISQVPEILNPRPGENSSASEFDQQAPQKTTISQPELKPLPVKSSQSMSPSAQKEIQKESKQLPKKIASPPTRADYDNNLSNAFDLSEVEHQPTKQVQLANPYAAEGGFGSRSQEQFASSGANREPVVQKNFNRPPEVASPQPPAYVGTPIASQAMIPSLANVFSQQNSPAYERERPAPAYHNESPRGIPVQHPAPQRAGHAMPPPQPPQYSEQGFNPQAAIAMEVGQGNMGVPQQPAAYAPQHPAYEPPNHLGHGLVAQGGPPPAQMNAPHPQYSGMGGAAAVGPQPTLPFNDNRRVVARDGRTRGPREPRGGRSAQQSSSSLGIYLIVIVAGITMGLTVLIGFFASRKNSRPIPFLQAMGLQQNSSAGNPGRSKKAQAPVQQEQSAPLEFPAQVIQPRLPEPVFKEPPPEKTNRAPEKRRTVPAETRRSEPSSRPKSPKTVSLAARRAPEREPQPSNPLPSTWPAGPVTNLKQLKLKTFKVVSVDGIQISSVPRSCEPCKLEGTLNGGGKVFLVSASPDPWNGVSSSSRKIAIKGFVRRDEKGRFSIIVQSVVER